VPEEPAGIQTHQHGAIVHIALSGALDCSSRAKLTRTVEDVMASPRLDQVVVDLRRVEFLDSTMLGVLVMADRRARRAGIRLSFVKGPRAAQRPFELTHVDQYLTFVDLPPETEPQERQRPA
jgi:anti-anti-sigma factor